jgi:hypothetical protein
MTSIDIGGGYNYTALRIGLVVRNPAGIEIYVQPGDASATMLDNIAALDELPDNKRGIVADMILGEYFA